MPQAGIFFKGGHQVVTFHHSLHRRKWCNRKKKGWSEEGLPFAIAILSTSLVCLTRVKEVEGRMQSGAEVYDRGMWEEGGSNGSNWFC